MKIDDKKITDNSDDRFRYGLHEIDEVHAFCDYEST